MTTTAITIAPSSVPLLLDRAKRAIWTARYQITSLRGRVWSREMVRRRVVQLGRGLGLPVIGRLVDEVLDDDLFMTRRRGEIPARVVDAVHQEARLRRGPCSSSRSPL